MIPPVPAGSSNTTNIRGGVVTKYFRRNSGEVESSPFYSTWFREDIIADQRFERRRKQIPSQRTKTTCCSMEVDRAYNRCGESCRSIIRGKRQVDCKICNAQLTDWTDITSLPCYHLYHKQCYQYWLNRTHHPPASCPVCLRSHKLSEQESLSVPSPTQHPVPAVLQSPQLFCQDQSTLLRAVVLETSPAVVTPDVVRGDVVTPGVVRGDVVTPGVVRGDVIRGDVVRHDVVRGDIIRGDVVTPGVVRGDVIRGDVVRGDVVRGDIIRGDVVRHDVAKNEGDVPENAGEQKLNEGKAAVRLEC